MNKIIFLNAGHSQNEPGGIVGEIKERDLNISIRDALVIELARQGFEIKAVPDNLDFIESYKWVNQNSKSLNDGLALDIHCNKGGKNGAEVYYYPGDKPSLAMAQKLLAAYGAETGLKNGGAIPDTQSAVGEIAWIRKTIPYALLIECGYMDSTDLAIIKGNPNKIAKGIMKGLCAIFEVEYKEETKLELPSQALAEIVAILKKYKYV